MAFYRDRVLPLVTEVALSGKEFERVRARVTSGLEGDVVEVGFGTGRNVPHYPQAINRVRAVEPAHGGRRFSTRRTAATSVPVEFVGLSGESLPIDDATVDHVLTTWTLCTIPDVEQALAEIMRVLRPGGSLHFVEHGRSPEPSVAKWQDRLTPVQKVVFGGCHLNRQIDALVAGSGLELTELDTYSMRGPKVSAYMFEGVATKR